jgi:hypothetical protein
MHTSTAPVLRTALDFARESLDLDDPTEGLIFDLQNANEVLAKHGSDLPMLRGICEDLVESDLWNAAELRDLLKAAPADPYAYHGALRRSLLAKF